MMITRSDYIVYISTNGFEWVEAFTGSYDNALDEAQSYLLEGYIVKLDEKDI